MIRRGGGEIIVTCIKCGKKWTWKDTFSKMPKLKDKKVSCPYCGKEQYLTGNRKSFVIHIIATAFLLSNFEKDLYVISITASLLAVSLLLLPFGMKSETSKKRF
ncbi:TIGR04104 family putative zinc finger protein [Halobacillus litoralis]|uniref:TIGR04104 family putative zinc finger protein n=1 Tax=Halobacillus litoralis TaxID=45668 RepID=UPI001CFF29A8|nr:TIGR04104 family putative zinc finger protein [Halobacillus litoralis]